MEQDTRGSAKAGGAVYQNQGEGHGGAAHQTPGHTPPVRGQSRLISQTTTGDCLCEHH